jgi:hypothetical protein
MKRWRRSVASFRATPASCRQRRCDSGPLLGMRDSSLALLPRVCGGHHPSSHGRSRFHRYDLVVRQMMTVDPLQPVLTRLGEVLRSGHRVLSPARFLLPIRIIPCPFCHQRIETPPAAGHGGDCNSLWQHQAAQLLSAHAERGGEIEIPVPGKRVQGFENLALWVVEGWR